VHGERDEVVELDLGRRDEPGERGADGALHEEVLRDRAVDYPHRAELFVEPLRGLEHAAVDGNVLTDQEDALVALHLLVKGLVDGFDDVDRLHVGRRGGGCLRAVHGLHRCVVSPVDGCGGLALSRWARRASAALASRSSSSVSNRKGGTGAGRPCLSIATNVRYAVEVCFFSPVRRSSHRTSTRISMDVRPVKVSLTEIRASCPTLIGARNDI